MLLSLLLFCYLPLFLVFLLSQLILKRTVARQTSIDQYYYIGLVMAIKRKRNRFVVQHPNIIDEHNFITPQLFFWLCSFFPERLIRKNAWYLSYITHLVTFFVVITLYAVVYHLLIPAGNEWLALVFLSGLLYIFTPFYHAAWLVRNIAFSARNFGLLLGILQVGLVLYARIRGFDVYMFSALTLLNVLVIVGSLFTVQFSFFFLLFISFFFKNVFYFVTFPAGLLVCLGLFPSITLPYLRGQYWHKYIFNKYLARDFLLTGRPSIWRDLVFDIWKTLKNKGKGGIYYAITNPVVFIFLGMPVFMVCMLLAPSALKDPGISGAALVYDLYAIVFSCAFCFLITSFRKTRFLGEPERYMEFANPFCILLFNVLLLHGIGKNSIFLSDTVLIILSGVLSGLLLVYNFFRNRKTNLVYTNNFMLLKEEVTAKIKGPKVLLSNSWNVCRMFYDTEFLIPNPEFTSLKMGPFRLLDIFKKSWLFFEEDIIAGMVEHYKPDVFIRYGAANGASFLQNYKLLGCSGECEIFVLNEK
jgi:hypothetical protein